MKCLKSGLMLLSAALMSGGCEQSTSDNFANALPLAKAKMNPGSEAREFVTACSEHSQHSAELVRLRQRLQHAQQQLADSHAALVAAGNQLKDELSTGTPKPVALYEQEHAKPEHRLSTPATRQVRQLERRLTEQDLQLSKLHQTLLQTEENCREIADELQLKS